MSNQRSRRVPPADYLAIGLGLAGVPLLAGTQPHERAFGRYLIRAEVVGSDSLPLSALERHHLAIEAGRALLSVLVLEEGKTPRETAPATVLASAHEPGGAERQHDMHAVVVSGRLSRVGVIPATTPGTLEFTVTAFADDDTAYRREFSDAPEDSVR